MLERIGLGGEEYRDRKVFRGRGCAKCHSTGFKGRRGIFELLHMTQDMKALILQTSDANEIRRKAIENGMVTLQQDGAQKVLEGVTTIEEVYRVSQQ
jgi:general secretion pathway protein E